MKKSTFPNPQRGITLVEACIVLAVTAILASTAAPGMQSLIDTRRLDGAASQLATDLQFIRTEAVARNMPLRLSFHAAAAGTCYVIHTGNADQCDCTTAGAATGPAQCSGGAQQIKTVRTQATDRVALQSNVASMLFDPLHGTSTPTGTFQMTGAGNRTVRHVVNVMGRVRSCSPQGAVAGYRAC